MVERVDVSWPMMQGARMDELPSIELLNNTHRFPGPYVFKAIGRAENGFAARVVAAVREELSGDVDPPFRVRRSHRRAAHIRHRRADRANRASGAGRVSAHWHDGRPGDALVKKQYRRAVGVSPLSAASAIDALLRGLTPRSPLIGETGEHCDDPGDSTDQQCRRRCLGPERPLRRVGRSAHRSGPRRSSPTRPRFRDRLPRQDRRRRRAHRRAAAGRPARAGRPVRADGPARGLRQPAPRRQDRRSPPRRLAQPHPRAAHRHQQAPDLLRPGMGQACRRAGPKP